MNNKLFQNDVIERQAMREVLRSMANEVQAGNKMSPAIDTVRAEQVAQQNIAAPLPVCVPGAPLPAAFIVFTSWTRLPAVHPTVAAEFELRRVADGPVFPGAIYPVRVVAPDNVWIGEPCATQEEAERAALAHLREPVEKNRYWITACNERGQVTVNHLHDAATEGEAREWAYRHVAREQRESICVTLHSRAGRAPITVNLAKRAAPECVAVLHTAMYEPNAEVMARAVEVVRNRRLTAEYLAVKDGDEDMECDYCGCEKSPGTIDGLCADCRHDEDNHAAIVARDNRDPMATEHCETCGGWLESGQIGDCYACQEVKA